MNKLFTLHTLFFVSPAGFGLVFANMISVTEPSLTGHDIFSILTTFIFHCGSSLWAIFKFIEINFPIKESIDFCPLLNTKTEYCF